jgi:hypothetical protein
MKSLNVIASGLMTLLLFGITGSAQAALTAYYSLNGSTNDTSGNGYNGTVNGTTSYGGGINQSQAFKFNGSTNIATTTVDNLGIYNGSFTVDAEVNFSNPTGGDVSVGGTTTSGTDLGLHLLERGDHPFFGFYGDDTGASTPNLAAGTWYNIAWVYNDTGNHNTNSQSIYVNGQLVATTTGHNDFAGTGETFEIGQSCCGSEMSGLIEDLGVYNTALSQAQIQALVQTPEPSSIVALVGLCGMGLIGLVRYRRRKTA